MHVRRILGQTPLGIDSFLASYRALFEKLLAKSALDLGAWSIRRRELLASPLDLAADLFDSPTLASIRKSFRTLANKVGADHRGVFEDAAREVVVELIPAPPVRRMEAGSPSQPASSMRKRARVRRGMGGDDTESVSLDASPGDEDSSGGLLSADPRERMSGAEPPTDEPSFAAPDEVAAPTASAAPPAPSAPAEVRFLNSAIAGHKTGDALTVGQECLLEIWIDLAKRGDASARVPDAAVTHRADEDTIELTIQVTSADFTIAQDSLPLKLPRRGPSAGKARFDIVPKHDGPSTLDISVHKEGNFLFQMQVSYSVGAVATEPATAKVNGRSLGAAAQLQARELGMTIKQVVGGYECVVRGAVHTSVVLKLTETALADAVKTARDAMMSVVTHRDEARNFVFQKGAEFVISDASPNGGVIAPASQDVALRTLARAGALLFRTLFFGPAASAEVKKIGELLRRLATRPEQRLTLQIVAERFPVPWALLYMGSTAEGEALDWDLFLGMRHIIEQIPLQTDMLVDDTVIASDKPGLAVSVNVHAGIDAQMKLDVVARQLGYWSKQVAAGGQRLSVAERKSRADILKALRASTPEQLMYLYCHAVTNAPTDEGGIKGSCFVFTGDERLTLADLDLDTADSAPLPGNPLVFINACESGELRPEFYDGFIPYFMARGARGVVGTECKTPAIFATEWALRFFPRFLGGEPLGELFLNLRREFRDQHGNPLGLLYNVYCDGDTRVQPALTF